MEKQVQGILMDTHPTFVVAESPKQDLWDTGLDQLDDVARRPNLDPGIAAILRQPERELTVSVSVVMDDGLIKVFTGYRVQHFSAREPCQDGIRCMRRVGDQFCPTYCQGMRRSGIAHPH